MSTPRTTRRSNERKPRSRANAAAAPDRAASAPSPPVATEPPDAPDPTGTHSLEHALAALAVDPETAQRIQRLPRDVGWLLVTAGVVGVVMPGVLGLPFLALGGLILWPGNNQRAERWLSGQAPTLLKGSMRQISRFLDDLEKRYPRGGTK